MELQWNSKFEKGSELSYGWFRYTWYYYFVHGIIMKMSCLSSLQNAGLC